MKRDGLGWREPWCDFRGRFRGVHGDRQRLGYALQVSPIKRGIGDAVGQFGHHSLESGACQVSVWKSSGDGRLTEFIA